MQELRVKNMVCDRCIMVLKQVLQQENIPFLEVRLGQLILKRKITTAEKKALGSKLNSLGFELLDDENSILIERIKTLLRHWVFAKASERPITNVSEYLAAELHKEYTGLSRLFSAVEGITIEKYLKKLKVERAKELLVYDRWSLAEIAHELDYANASYLTSLFKKETGLTPREFKLNHPDQRRSLDEL